jgi:hypothetical protein
MRTDMKLANENELHAAMERRDRTLGTVAGGALGAAAGMALPLSPIKRVALPIASAVVGNHIGGHVGQERALSDKVKRERQVADRERGQEHRMELLSARKHAAAKNLGHVRNMPTGGAHWDEEAYDDFAEGEFYLSPSLQKLTLEQHLKANADAPLMTPEEALGHRRKNMFATGALFGGLAGIPIGAGISAMVAPRSTMAPTVGAALGGLGGGALGGTLNRAIFGTQARANKDITVAQKYKEDLKSILDTPGEADRLLFGDAHAALQRERAARRLESHKMAAMADELGHLKVAINLAPLAAMGTKAMGAVRAAAPKVLGAVENVGARAVSGLERMGGAGLNAANPAAKRVGQGVIGGLNRAETMVGGAKNLNRAVGGTLLAGGGLAAAGAANSMMNRGQR